MKKSILLMLGPLSGHFNGVEYLADDGVGSYVFGLSLIGQSNAMAQYVEANSPYVFWNNITPSLDESIGFGCQCKVDTGTWRRAIIDHSTDIT